MNIADLKILDFLILHEGNHNDRGNPHPQYALISDKEQCVLAVKGDITSGNYGKLLECNITTWQPSTLNLNFYVCGIGNRNELKETKGIINLRCSSQDTPSTQPNTIILTYGNIDPALVKGILEYNSNTASWKISIYMKCINPYTTLFTKSLSSSTVGYDLSLANITYFSNQNYAVLPTGTTINALYNEKSQISTSGYKIYNDGLIESWDNIGYTGLANGAAKDITVTFPTVFVYSPLNIQCTLTSNSNQAVIVVHYKLTNTGAVITIKNIDTAPTDGYLAYRVIGY